MKGRDAMSLYGINAYNSNSLYSSLTSLLSGSSLVTSYNNNKTSSASNTDLYELAKKANYVRSASYRKSMKEEFQKALGGTSTGEIGSTASEMKVSENAKNLSAYAKSLSAGNYDDLANPADTVKNFVESYNNKLSELQEAGSYQADSLINTTKSYVNSLSKIGVTIGDNNRLSVDADKLKNVSSGDVKALFNSSKYSYANKVGLYTSDAAGKMSDTIKSFVSSYNSTLDSLEKSDSANALEKGISLVNTTKAFSRTLSRIGISVGSDNRLSIDSDQLAKASDSDFKSLFNGSYSYATKVADKASYISRAAGLSAQISYNSKGQTNNTNIYDMLSSIMFSNKA